MQTSKTGIVKFFIYMRIGLHVLWRYRRGMNRQTLRRAALLLAAFRHNKLIRVNSTYKLHLYLPAYPTGAFFRAVENKLFSSPPKPVTVVLSTTKKCGYSCPHCYQKLDAAPDISKETLLRTVDHLAAAGVCFLNVEGGDAFLDFSRLLAVADQARGRMEVWINTTGDNVTPDKLHMLKAHGVYGLMISLHGVNAQEHDTFTGRNGSFDVAMNALRWCAEAGLASSVNTVLEYDMMEKGALKKIMKIAGQMKCGFVQLIHPKRAGKWLENRDLDIREKALVKQVRKMHRKYNGIRHPSYPALPAQAMEEQADKFGCTAGAVDRFYIGAGGEVQPCEFLNISFGNVREEPFERIFNRMRSYFPYPCEDWLCSTQADAIAGIKNREKITATPLPLEYTLELMKNFKRGNPTALYRKMKIYE